MSGTHHSQRPLNRQLPIRCFLPMQSLQLLLASAVSCSSFSLTLLQYASSTNRRIVNPRRYNRMKRNEQKGKSPKPDVLEAQVTNVDRSGELPQELASGRLKYLWASRSLEGQRGKDGTNRHVVTCKSLLNIPIFSNPQDDKFHEYNPSNEYIHNSGRL